MLSVYVLLSSGPFSVMFSLGSLHDASGVGWVPLLWLPCTFTQNQSLQSGAMQGLLLGKTMNYIIFKIPAFVGIKVPFHCTYINF